MTLNEKIELAFKYQNTVNKWRNDFKSVEYNFCSELSKELFYQPFNFKYNCGCVDDLFVMLSIKVKNTLKEKEYNMEKLFVIKKGVSVASFYFKRPLDANSSDEECIKLLSLNKNFIKQFEKYPENWENIVDKKEPLLKENVSIKKTVSRKKK